MLGQQLFLFGVAVEARHGAEPTDDRGTSSPLRFEVAAEGLNVCAPGTEQRDPAFGAPRRLLAKIVGVRVTSQTAVAREDPASASSSSRDNSCSHTDIPVVSIVTSRRQT